MRADFAQIQNEVLEQNGFSIRVDHRSLEAQKEETEQNGDSSLAKLFSRVPEKYIGIIGNQEDDEPRLERLKKQLREEIRRYKKDEQKLAPKLLAYAKEEKQFQMRDWSVFSRSTFLQGKYCLTKQRTLLEIENGRLDQIKFSLQKKQTELETLCRQPDAAKKIDEIATGILRKNLRFVRQLK